jgi:hypothetical protein
MSLLPPIPFSELIVWEEGLRKIFKIIQRNPNLFCNLEGLKFLKKKIWFLHRSKPDFCYYQSITNYNSDLQGKHLTSALLYYFAKTGRIDAISFLLEMGLNIYDICVWDHQCTVFQIPEQIRTQFPRLHIF